METTEQLDAHSDSRKLVPSKYVYGTFTPDVEGVGYTQLPEQDVLVDGSTIAVWNGIQLVQMKVSDVVGLGITNVKDVGVSNWNTLTTFSGYGYVHTVQGTTQNSPENVTDDWFVEGFKHGTTVMLVATRVSNPSSRWIRTYHNGSWSNWVLTYAVYRP